MRLSTFWRPLALPFLLLGLSAAPAQAQYNRAVTIPNGFTDISATGTQVAAAEADDAISALITFPAGFTFTYFGTAATGFKVDSNGWMTVVSTATSTAGNGLLPTATTGSAAGAIAPFWDDLDNDNSSTGVPNSQVDYQYDAANNRLIVQWTNVKRYAAGTNTALGNLNFQAHLYTDGTIEYHYATMADPGASYSVGLQNAGGTIGITSVVNGSAIASSLTPRVESNTAIRYTLATGPVPQLTASQFFFTTTAGSCVGDLARSLTIGFSNQGATTMTVTGATVAGSSAFTVGTPRTSAGADTAYPLTLAPGASFSAVAQYYPPAGQTGLQSAVFTVNTDGGNVAFPVQGTADSRGAGFAFRSTLTPAACATNGAGAPGTAFVPLTGHTRVTTYTSGTGDDGRFNLVLSSLGTAFPAVRFGRTDFTTLALLTNGSVSTSTTALTTFYGANASATTYIQAAASNLTLAVTGDAGGVGGEPGLYYGLSDVNSDGIQELVVTWWHAYDFGSTAGPAGQYLTTQLILYRNRANEETVYEVRFPDGVDANSVAYRQNTTVADSPTDVSIEDDAVTGIVESNGAESALARLRAGAVGGSFIIGLPMYATGGGSTGIRFQPEAFATAAGQAGWRMMGVPVRGATVGQLATLNLVQSVTNQYPTFPQDNLYTSYDGAGYVAATSTVNALTPGRGFIWYLFNQDCDPTGVTAGLCTPGGTPATGGTSRSYALPMRLEAVGAEPATTINAYPIGLSTAGNGFNLVANPFRDDLDVTGIASWASGGTLVSSVPAVWDPNAGSTGSYVNVSGSVSGWQGFFIQTTPGAAGASALTVPTTARNVAGPFYGRAGLAYSNDRLDSAEGSASAATLAFELSGTVAATGQTTVDRAATLVLNSDAADAWDLLDATKLAPLASAYATVGFQGPSYDGQPAVKAQESRPASTAGFDVPLVIDAAGTNSALTISWAGLDDLPATWGAELRDLVTGAVVNLRTVASYSFDQVAAAAIAGGSDALISRTTTAAQAKAGAAPRFVLRVAPRGATAGEGTAVTEFALAAPSPNPTASTASVTFDVPAAADVSVSVYDLLGRRVAVLAEGQVAAGRHTSRLDAGALAPGVYVVRMQSGTFVATQRVTVVR